MKKIMIIINLIIPNIILKMTIIMKKLNIIIKIIYNLKIKEYLNQQNQLNIILINLFIKNQI